MSGQTLPVPASTDTEPFEVRRRSALYVAAALGPLLLGAVAGWLAWSERDVVLAVVAGVLGLFFLLALPGLLDLGTPLFVADGHGVRMRSGRQWVGMLWGEIGGVHVESRAGRHDPCIKIVSPDGARVHRTPVGFATTASVEDARDQLARRRAAAAY